MYRRTLENHSPQKNYFLFGPPPGREKHTFKVLRIEPTLLWGIQKAVRFRPCPRRGLAPCFFFCRLLWYHRLPCLVLRHRLRRLHGSAPVDKTRRLILYIHPEETAFIRDFLPEAWMPYFLGILWRTTNMHEYRLAWGLGTLQEFLWSLHHEPTDWGYTQR